MIILFVVNAYLEYDIELYHSWNSTMEDIAIIYMFTTTIHDGDRYYWY